MKTVALDGGQRLTAHSRRGWLLCCLSTAAPAAFGKRSVSGTVTDQHGKPLLRAAVQMKELRTLRVRSFITGQNGQYRFTTLSPDHNYELQALYHAHRTEVRNVSIFDAEREIVIDFTIEVALRPAQL